MWGKKKEPQVRLAASEIRKPVTNTKLIAAVFLGTGILSVLAMWWGGRGSGEGWWGPAVLSFSVTREVEPTAKPDLAIKEFEEELTAKVESAVGTYGIYVYRLNQGVSYGINETVVMPGMSIMKVPIMIAVMDAIEKGSLSMDDIYVLANKDKRSGSGPIEYWKEGTEVSVNTLMEEMGKKSDNTAPVVLTRMVGKSAIENQMYVMGMTKSLFSENTTTAEDVGKMWKAVYEKAQKNNEFKNRMWSDLSESIYEDRLSVGLPTDVTLIHKVGTDYEVWADAGIVIPDKPEQEPLIIVIMNEGVNRAEAETLVPELTEMIWNFEVEKIK